MSVLAIDSSAGGALPPSLLSFNLLPSRWLHPSRQGGWIAAQADQCRDPAAWRRLHRHASAQILRDTQPGIVQRLDEPLLPLFLAPPALFDRLVQHAGLLVLGPAIRRVIARDEVRALQAAIDAQGLAFVRQVAAGLWPGEGPAGQDVALDLPHALRQVHALGGALLFLASQGAAPPVADRALLRLEVDVEAHLLDLPPSLDDRELAARLALSVLAHLDPAWLSAFPARH